MRRLLIGLALLAAVTPARAEVRVIVREGGWTDVVKTPSGFAQVRATDREVVTELVGGPVRWSTPIPEPILYLRAAADNVGTIEAIMQGNATGTAYVVSAAGVRPMGPSFGQNATAIAWFAARGFVYYIQQNPTTYHVYDAAGCQPCLVTMPATSQGFRDIQPDGTVRLADEYRTDIFNGRRLWEYAQRGAVTVGQCDPPGICAAVDGKTFTIFRGFAFEPHQAEDGRTFAVATRASVGAVVVLVAPPYPPADDLAPPAPRPDPLPTPSPVPTPAQGMPDRRAVLEELRSGYGSTLTHQQAGELMARLAFRLKAEGFGLIRKDGGNNCPVPNSAVRVSCDILLHRPTSTYCDVLVSGPDTLENGALQPGPSMATWCAGTPGDMANFFSPPDPGGTTIPTPTPTPPTSGVTRAELDAAIATLRVEIAAARAETADVDRRLSARIAAITIDLPALQAAIDAALANLWVTGSVGRTLGHVHSIDLRVTKRK